MENTGKFSKEHQGIYNPEVHDGYIFYTIYTLALEPLERLYIYIYDHT